MEEVIVVDWVRTPRGRGSIRGGLHAFSPLDLVVHLMRALPQRVGLDPAEVGDVVLGCADQVGEQGGNLARTAALLAGWGPGVPGATVNRFCVSGLDAVGQVAARLRSGEYAVGVAGGVESTSRVPIFSDGGPLWSDPAVVSAIGSVHMGIAADLNATLDGFGRAELDGYAVETHGKAAAAWARGDFARSVIPMPGGLAHDELVRPDMSLESIADLPPAFAALGAAGQDEIALAASPLVERIEHRHTVASSPAMADGAVLVLLATARAAAERGWTPRARIVAGAGAAVDPVRMLTAGQEAVEAVLARTGIGADALGVVEFAEAFSALCLRLRRDLGFGEGRLNPWGGTMAMGHAFGATGAIIVGQLVDELEALDRRYGVAAVSGAAGLGSALLLER